MKRNVALWMALMIILTFTLAVDAQEQSPTAALVRIVDLLRKHDHEAVKQMLVDPAGMDAVLQSMEDPRNEAVFNKLLATVSVSYGPERVDGDLATVDITLHSIRGEAIYNLNAYLELVQGQLPADAGREEKAAAIYEAMEKLDWKGFAPHSYALRYHLQRVDGVWKLDTTKQEEL